jgi:hypothetical protein
VIVPARKRRSGDEERKPDDGIDDDRLSVRRARPRHDETRVPRGHTRAGDDWPVASAKRAPGAKEPTAEDRALLKETAWLLEVSLATGITDEVRTAVLAAYRALMGYAWGEECVAALGFMLRQREQARIAASIRTHRYGDGPAPLVEGRVAPPTTGVEIVKQLQAMAATWERKRATPPPAWLADPALVKAIDTLTEGVNLGGAGGPLKGKTPETWAKTIARNLTGRAANS